MILYALLMEVRFRVVDNQFDVGSQAIAELGCTAIDQSQLDKSI